MVIQQGDLFFQETIGGGATALLSDLGPLESASGMFSALGNIGPCYISVQQMTELHWAVKLTYIVGMLAGRLEIIPILMIFMPRGLLPTLLAKLRGARG